MAAWPINPFFTRVSEGYSLEVGSPCCSDSDYLREAQDKLRRDRVGGNEGRPIAQSILWFGMVRDGCNRTSSIPKSALPLPMAKVIEFYSRTAFTEKWRWFPRKSAGK